METHYAIVVELDVMHTNTTLLTSLKEIFSRNFIPEPDDFLKPIVYFAKNDGKLIHKGKSIHGEGGIALYYSDADRVLEKQISEFVTTHIETLESDVPFVFNLSAIKIDNGIVTDSIRVHNCVFKAMFKHNEEYKVALIFGSFNNEITRNNTCFDSLALLEEDFKDDKTPIYFIAKKTETEVLAESVSKAMQDADNTVTDPQQKTFLQKLREMIGI